MAAMGCSLGLCNLSARLSSPGAAHHAASAAPFLGPDLRHAAAQSRPEAGPWHSAAGTGEISVWRG